MGAVAKLRTLAGEPNTLDVGKLFVDTKRRYEDAKIQSLSDVGPARLRVDFAWGIIELIGNLINKTQEIRNEIEESEEGLTAFDQDLAGLRARYRIYYVKFFDGLPPFEEWTLEQWADYEDRIEGPIFYWNIADCRKKWGVEFGAPQCEGPDLLTALSLFHQSGVAAEFEAELVASFYGIFDLTMQDFSEFYADIARKAARELLEGVTDITEFMTPGHGFRTFALLAVTAGAAYLGYKWFTADTSEETSEEEDP